MVIQTRNFNWDLVKGSKNRTKILSFRHKTPHQIFPKGKRFANIENANSTLFCAAAIRVLGLSRLLKLVLLFAIEAWTTVVASCCESALRADFFLKTTLEAAEGWAALGC